MSTLTQIRIIDIEFRGRLDRDAYLEHRCDEIMDKIRSAREQAQLTGAEEAQSEGSEEAGVSGAEAAGVTGEEAA